MNYIAEINAFERWLETNHLSVCAQLLWYKLFMLFNKSGWSECIQVDNHRLMSMIQAKREATFIHLRGELISAGLLEYFRGKKGKPSKYKYVPVPKAFTDEAQAAALGAANSGANSAAQTAAIYKPNKTKSKIFSDENNARASTPRQTLVKPTPEEIKAYCPGIDAERFFDHYEANGWLVGKAPMRDWQAAVRQWQRRGEAFSRYGGEKKPQSLRYDQRAYSAEDLDALIMPIGE